MKKTQVPLSLKLKKTLIVSLTSSIAANVVGGVGPIKKPEPKTNFSCYSCESRLDTCNDPGPIQI